MPLGPSYHDEYQAEDDMRTLKRAEEIKADASRMARAKDAAEKMMRAVEGDGSQSSGEMLKEGFRKLS